jgi:putative pyruvate formate lyase activating enzyme
MVRQVGDDLQVEKGLATHGIIIRHLVLPGRLDNSREALKQLKNKISTNVPISLMSQYTPIDRVKSHPQLGRRITGNEYHQIVDYALDLGFENLFIQEVNDDTLTPDFNRDNPFD